MKTQQVNYALLTLLMLLHTAWSYAETSAYSVNLYRINSITGHGTTISPEEQPNFNITGIGSVGSSGKPIRFEFLQASGREIRPMENCLDLAQQLMVHRGKLCLTINGNVEVFVNGASISNVYNCKLKRVRSFKDCVKQ